MIIRSETLRSVQYGRDQGSPGGGLPSLLGREQHTPYRASFGWTWDEINGERFTWRQNPWVWVVHFKLLEVRR